MKNPFNKIRDINEVLSHFTDGCTIMFGGFGGVGSPPTLISGILGKGIKNLTIIGNDTGFPTIGIGQLISSGQVKKVIASHIGSNPIAGQLMTEGKLEVEFSPQGTLVERIRSGGVGIPAFLTDIGVDSEFVRLDKTVIKLHGKEYLLETALTAPLAIVFAKKADEYGNLIFDKSARNTNPLVAMAGELTIVEVEEIVPVGTLDPDEIVVPGVYVDYIVASEGVNWKWAWE